MLMPNIFAWILSICMDRVRDNGALPVELNSFASLVSGRDRVLNWSTSSERNNAGFEIERRITGSDSWGKIGEAEGNGTTTFAREYGFVDRNLASGRFNYRLEQVDYNGNVECFNLNNEIQIGTPNGYELSIGM
jgi:hypothetical protein